MGHEPLCKTCGAPLVWGRFSHNQDTCWPCFSEYVRGLKDWVDNNLHDEQESAKALETIDYLMSVLAENFGEEW